MAYGIDLTTLKLGDHVSIARNNHGQGTYVVTKINKVRVEVARAHDGHTRKFSMKTGLESGSSMYHSANLETVATAELREARNKALSEYNAKWHNIELCAKTRELKLLKQLVDEMIQSQ